MEQARRLIAENLRTQNPYLDLGNCGLTDLRELPELFECTHLEELVLSNEWYKHENKTIQFLYGKRFRGEDNKIKYLSTFFSKLKSLKKLVLVGGVFERWEIDNISDLLDLNQLIILDLSLNIIIDISSLKKLKQLKSLDLWNTQIHNLSFLRELIQLANLNLSSNQVSDISILKELTLLTDLNLSSNQVSDISSLKDLTQLTNLYLSGNQLSDISSLKELSQLTNLYLSGNQLSDIAILKALTRLTNLDLNDNQLSDISSLKDLTQLNNLDLSYNQISDISSLKDLTQLNNLFLSRNPIQYIPKEIYEKYNCAKDLFNYWQEIEKSGSAINNQLKVMFLGNGCVGKTTLLHWFIDNEFKDIAQDVRTEGIIIHSESLCDKQVMANFWDFGGQEVYHATHRLFLGQRTLYILVWATETPEKESEQRHPPQYWLDMIADIQGSHERSTVLIVQNLFEHQVKQNVVTNAELQYYHQKGLDIKELVVNAKTGDDIDDFKSLVENNAKKLLQKHIEELPSTWVEIRKAIAKRKQNKEKTLAWADFLSICKDCELTTSTKGVIEYLHRAGEVFYYENQFDNQIILDQMWVLDKVYAVLKSKNIERYKGILTLDDLIEIWQQQDSHLTIKECQIFLNFMLENQLMFYTEDYKDRKRKEEFVIPQLLSEDKPKLLKTWEHIPSKLQYRIDYAFLHRDIIERFIVSTAHLSKDKEYWRNGLYINYQGNDAAIEVIENEDKKKIISIQCVGNQKDILLQKIREEFNKIRPLEKAKEYVFENEIWHLVDEKLQIKENSGFPERGNQLNFETLLENLPSLIKNNVPKLKRMVSNNQYNEVFEALILHYKNDKEKQNTVLTLQKRWKTLQDEIHQGIISHDNEKIENNKITKAVFELIDALD